MATVATKTEDDGEETEGNDDEEMRKMEMNVVPATTAGNTGSSRKTVFPAKWDEFRLM